MFEHFTKHTQRHLFAFVCALLAPGLASMALAQDTRKPSAADIVRKLTPAEAPAASAGATESAPAAADQPAPRINTRGIRVENRIPTVQPAPAPDAPIASLPPTAPDSQTARVPPPAPSLDLEVNFEYASARLTPDARIVLDNLGQALNDPALRDSRMRIAGHTDAKGADAYNLNLSRQRAQSVAEYLSRQHGVDMKRLSVEGFGRTQLLDAANPESAVNRRVQVVNLGKSADQSGR